MFLAKRSYFCVLKNCYTPIKTCIFLAYWSILNIILGQLWTDWNCSGKYFLITQTFFALFWIFHEQAGSPISVKVAWLSWNGILKQFVIAFAEICIEKQMFSFRKTCTFIVITWPKQKIWNCSCTLLVLKMFGYTSCTLYKSSKILRLLSLISLMS